MTAKHTPGPWRLNGEDVRGGSEDTAIVTLCNRSRARLGVAGYENQRAEDGANLRLIVAAPELLAALEAFNEWRNDYGDSSQELNTVVEKALGAIAKAKGLTL